MTTNNLFALLALIGLTITAYLYWPFSQSAEATIKNATDKIIAVRLESDSGTLYPVSTVVAGASAQIPLTGKDHTIWAIALYADGQSKESAKIPTVKGALSVMVSNSGIDIGYK